MAKEENKDVRVEAAVEGLTEYMYNLFGGYQSTGDRQNILAGLFKWLKENKHDPMSPGEVASAIKKGFPEILEKDTTWLSKN